MTALSVAQIAERLGKAKLTIAQFIRYHNIRPVGKCLAKNNRHYLYDFELVKNEYDRSKKPAKAFAGDFVRLDQWIFKVRRKKKREHLKLD